MKDEELLSVKTNASSKLIAKEKLKDLIEKYEQNRDVIINPVNKYNESEARNEYIDPFLEILGWDIQNRNKKSFSMRDVSVESYINSHSKPDYLLRRNGVSVMAVEAEKPSKNLHVDKLDVS